MTTIMKWIEWLDCGLVGNHYPAHLINKMLYHQKRRWRIAEEAKSSLEIFSGVKWLDMNRQLYG